MGQIRRITEWKRDDSNTVLVDSGSEDRYLGIHELSWTHPQSYLFLLGDNLHATINANHENKKGGSL